MEIKVRQLSDAEKKALKIPSGPVHKDGWSVWECAPSVFDWSYDADETAYVYQGRVRVTSGGKVVEIKAGDLAVFPQGLSCRWEVLEKIVKVYRF